MKNRMFIFLALVLATASCTNFLEVKPDQRLATPTTSSDLQALLDHFSTINQSFAIGLGEIGSDNYYMTNSDWEAISDELERNLYIWRNTPVILGYWVLPYSRILVANTVLEFSTSVNYETGHQKNEILGTAYFTRGMSFYDLSQVFSPPFDEAIASEKLGVPIRLTADVNYKSVRSTIGELYSQIISDLQKAADLLPLAIRKYPTQPSKASAYAALSRVYLAKRDYQLAGLYADSCLKLYDKLINYNELEEVRPYVLDRYNEEVIYYAEVRGNSYLSDNRATVDSTLYQSFHDNDIRKRLYFRNNNRNDGVNFVGDFSQNTISAKFCGITTAEVLLNRIESLIRINDMQEVPMLMSRFLEHRYQSGFPVEVDFNDKNQLLAMVLLERRKELMFRGIRWTDIRRLSYDANNEVTIQRNIAGNHYVLSPPDQRQFAYAIPQEVKDRSDL